MEEHIARLVVYGLPEMNTRELKRFTEWLRRQADELENDPDKYNKRYVARLF